MPDYKTTKEKLEARTRELDGSPLLQFLVMVFQATFFPSFMTNSPSDGVNKLYVEAYKKAVDDA